MPSEPLTDARVSPGDFTVSLPGVPDGDADVAVGRAGEAFRGWAECPLEGRIRVLERCREVLQSRSEEIARLIAIETGKPIREARLEMGAVVAKFGLAFADAERFLRDEEIVDGPHPAVIRRRPRGPAAVIAPFNFPVHLGHGAAVAYLLAGNPVLFKPSPLAVNVGAAYAEAMASVLPGGVLEFVPGGAATGRALAVDPRVRSVCFTGSIPVGRALARELAEDYSKSLALELGGKNSAIVWDDACLEAAAAAVADGMCLTAGQRCNATSRVFVHEAVAGSFLERLAESVDRYVPGNPLDDGTLLGPVISAEAVARYESLVTVQAGKWLRPGGRPGGLGGHYVKPAVLVVEDCGVLDRSDLAQRETFAPILVVETIRDRDEAILRHDAWDFGLTASVFTEDSGIFDFFAARLAVGNVYHNLPTTFSPSTLPFGGWGRSGNGHPGGRGFVRFAADEQSVQWGGLTR